ETLRTRFGVEIGRPLEGGEAIPVGSMHLDVLHLPGHAPNHLCFFLRERAVLFTGDNVVGEGSSWVGQDDGALPLYLEPPRRRQEPPARNFAAGRAPALDDARRRIQALIGRRLAREADIERLLREGPCRVEDLAEALYAGQVPGSVMEMARRTVLGHLIKLEREGRARPVEAGLWALGGSD